MGILHVPSTYWDLQMFLKEKGEFMTELDGRHIRGLVPRAKALQAEGRLFSLTIAFSHYSVWTTVLMDDWNSQHGMEKAEERTMLPWQQMRITKCLDYLTKVARQLFGITATTVCCNE